MTRVNFFSVLLIISAIMFLPFTTKAQVTIGSTDTPHDFSVLELISSGERGFRLPQLTSGQRDTLEATLPPLDARGLSTAMGLTIFNVTTRCVDTWNGREWISLCEGDEPDAPPYIPENTFFVDICDMPPPTIADLNAILSEMLFMDMSATPWFANAEGGTPLPVTHLLRHNATLWAEIDIQIEGIDGRIPVTVQLINCAAVLGNHIRVATFLNTMYDFQQQELMSLTIFGGEATEWQWQVSTTRDGTYTNIPGATSANWTIPVDLIHNPALVGLTNFDGMENNELFFRVKMRNSENEDGTWAEMRDDAILGIMFIPTTVSGQGSDFLPGYGKDANGVRWAEIGRGGSDTPFRIMLTNLGETHAGTWRNGERIDDGTSSNIFGDLYQWGRVADGHQHIVWGKAPRSVRTVFAEGTSVAIHGDYANMEFDENNQVTTSSFVGSFITDWNWGFWGNGATNRTAAANPWSEMGQANNPCPPGWIIPSSWDWFDMNRGNGRDNHSLINHPTIGYFPNSGNTWSSSRISTTTTEAANMHGVTGGLVITSRVGTKVFLPAAGRRIGDNVHGNGGALSNSLNLGGATHQWNSTANSMNTQTIISVAARLHPSYGLTLRCIAAE